MGSLPVDASGGGETAAAALLEHECQRPTRASLSACVPSILALCLVRPAACECGLVPLTEVIDRLAMASHWEQVHRGMIGSNAA